MNYGDRFLPRTPDDTARMLRDHPLAWVVSINAGAPAASLLPIRPQFSADGEVSELVGHFGRGNPQIDVVERNPQVMILFLGVNGYVSPSLGRDPTRGPTWNYASAQFHAEMKLTRAPDEIDALLRDLVEAMESRRPRPCSVDSMGPRYRSLSAGVVGFRARVLERRPRFKLGQDEPEPIYRSILESLDEEDRGDLATWMRRLETR